jgi:hypothetical protein
MAGSRAPHWRRIVNSLAYSALVALVAALGYLTFRAVGANRNPTDQESDSSESLPTSPIDVDSFVVRQERSSDIERLNVSLQMRLTSPGSADCWIYIVARNDRSTPHLWAVWPPQDAGGAITGGGYLRTGASPTGASVTLTPRWTRISGSLDHPPGKPPFETVTVYVVAETGQILLSRPFNL